MTDTVGDLREPLNFWQINKANNERREAAYDIYLLIKCLEGVISDYPRIDKNKVEISKDAIKRMASK